MSKEITAVKNGVTKIFPEATWNRLPGNHGWEPRLDEPEDLIKAKKPKPKPESQEPKPKTESTKSEQDGTVDE